MTKTLLRAQGRAFRRRFDRVLVILMGAAAVAVVVLAASILFFIGRAGVMGFYQNGLISMLTNLRWAPSHDPASYGIVPFFVGTMITALGSIVLGAMPAVLISIYLSEFASKRALSGFRRLMEVTAALPSVVFGYIAVTRLVPAFSNPRTGCQGLGIAPATLVLSAMIIPTVALLSLDALRRVPNGLREASAALGVSHWQTTWRAVVPTVWRGILVAGFFGFARAAGETMAVQMVAGNGQFAPIAALRPHGVHIVANVCPTFAGLEMFRPMSTISTRIIMDMPETQPGSPWNNALFSMSLLLLTMSTLIVLTTRWLSRRAAY